MLVKLLSQEKKIHEVLGWVDYCKDVSALLCEIENRLRWAQEVADDLTRETIDVLKAHLDDLKFLLEKLTPATKAEIADEKIESIKAKILKLGKPINYQF